MGIIVLALATSARHNSLHYARGWDVKCLTFHATQLQNNMGLWAWTVFTINLFSVILLCSYLINCHKYRSSDDMTPVYTDTNSAGFFFPLHTCLLASSVLLNIDDGTWTSNTIEAWEPQTARIIRSSSSWILVLLHTNTTELTWKYTFLLYCPCETLEHLCLCVFTCNTPTHSHMWRELPAVLEGSFTICLLPKQSWSVHLF